MFENCTSLESFEIPDNITSISVKAFKGCSSLDFDTLPTHLVNLGSEAFRDCTSLNCDLELPNTINSIGSGAFRHTSIIDFSMPIDMQSIPDYMFYDCDGLTYVKIESPIKTIGYYAFCGCNNITRIDLADGITTIRGYAFDGAHVHYQFIPGTVTILEGNAFNFSIGSDVAHYYTPYKYQQYIDSSIPSGWSHYFSGHELHEYTLLNPGDGNGCSRSDFEELAEQYHFFE